jgi:hypothetical protein
MPRRPPRGVWRSVVLRAREHLRDEHGEDHLARRFRVRPAPGLGAQGDQEDGAEIERHAENDAIRASGSFRTSPHNAAPTAERSCGGREIRPSD